MAVVSLLWRATRCGWRGLFAVGVCASVAYVLVPYSTVSELVVYDGIVGLAVVGSVVGARRARPPERRAWWLSSVALAGFLAGELTWWAFGVVGISQFPSVADVVFLGSYLPLGLAATSLVRARCADRDRGAWLDAGILTAVCGLALWDGLLKRYVHDQGAGGIALAFTLAYPLIDLLVLGLLLRLVFARAGRDRASTWLAVGIGLMLAADMLFAWQDLAGSYRPGTAVDAVWLISYLTIGFAPLVPVSAREGDRAPSVWLGRARLVLVLAALLVPELVVIGALADRQLLGLSTLGIAVWVSVAVVAMVAIRLWSLVGLAQRVEARRGERRLEALLTHSDDAILLVDPQNTIRYATGATATVTGIAVDAIVGASLADLLASESRLSLARQLDSLALMPIGSTVPIEGQLALPGEIVCAVEGTACNLLDDAAVGAIVVTLRDVSQRRELEEQLQRRAFHDDLTGLANRALFGDRVAHALDRARRLPQGTLAVLFVDLDDFKAVNDGMGHGAGDELICGVAARIRACVRPADTVARLGGDEFAVLLEDAASVDYATAVADRLLEVLQLPIDITGVSLAVPASIGISIAGPTSSVESLLRDADTAMYSAKALGKGRVALFDDSLRDRALERLSLKIELPEALRHGQFQLAYQPIHAIATNELTGVEALIRWQHPTRGLIGPNEFIPAAEQTGVIVEIGAWVLEQACRQAVAWNSRRDRPLTISVNVSGVQLHRPEFVTDLQRILEQTRLPAPLLVLEITETVLVDHHSVTTILERLRQIGVGIAVDDFGTGYSSLAYLRQFPITSIKVDRSFVADLTARGDASLVASIMSIAEALNLTTVAEGVETDQQLQALDQLACGLAQGFYLGHPQPATAIDQLLGQPAAPHHTPAG